MKTIPVGRIATLTGVGLLELRALARAGLLHPARKDDRGTFFYDETEVERVPTSSFAPPMPQLHPQTRGRELPHLFDHACATATNDGRVLPDARRRQGHRRRTIKGR